MKNMNKTTIKLTKDFFLNILIGAIRERKIIIRFRKRSITVR